LKHRRCRDWKSWARLTRVADHASGAKVRRLRASGAFKMVTKAFGAERGALHELMAKLAAVAPQGE